MIKVITGMRRCGKSYLLFTIFHDYLVEHGTEEDHIIMVDLENRRNMALRDPDVLLNHIYIASIRMQMANDNVVH